MGKIILLVSLITQFSAAASPVPSCLPRLADSQEKFVAFRFGDNFNSGISLGGPAFGNSYFYDIGNSAQPVYLDTQVSPIHVSSNKAILLSPSGKYAFVSTTREIVIFDTKSGNRLGYVSFEPNPDDTLLKSELRLSKDEQTFAFISPKLHGVEQSLEIYQVAPFKKISDDNIHGDFLGLAYAADSKSIYTTEFSADGRAIVQRNLKGEKLSELRLRATYPFVSLNLTPDGTKFILGMGYNEGHPDASGYVVYNAKTAQMISFFDTNRENINNQLFSFSEISSDSQLLALQNGWVYNLISGKLVFGKYRANYELAIGSKFSEDGKTFQIIYADHTIQRYDTSTWKLISETCQ